jgi:hypothetical protein
LLATVGGLAAVFFPGEEGCDQQDFSFETVIGKNIDMVKLLD